MFKNISIAARVTGGFILLLFTMLLIVADGVYSLKVIDREVQSITKGEMAFKDYIQSARVEVGNLRRFEKDSFITVADAQKHKEYHGRWGKTLATVREQLAQAGKVVSDENARKQLTDLEERLRGYETGYNDVYSQIAAGTITTTIDANNALDKYKPFVRGTEGIMQELSDLTNKHVATREEDLMKQIDNTSQLLLALGVIAMLLAIVGAFYVVRSIRLPLAQITALTEELASSRDLRRVLPDFGNNEIGRVATAMNHLIDTMRQLIAESHQHSARLVGVANELSQVNSNISHASTQQSHAAASSAASIEELTVSITVMAENAHGVEEQSRHTAEAAANGGVMANEAAKQIEQIANSITRTSATIDSLNQRSAEIGDIVRVIHDIADQTNLLALNAAIEAARAGEMGRGFAVVADEVRKLAERTSSATAEIAERIRGVQTDTGLAFSNMQEAGELIQNGVSGTQKVNAALESILSYSGQSVSKVTDMVDAIKEQSIASQEIAQNVEQIAQMNDNTRLSVEQAVQLAESLKTQSGELDHSIARFSV